MPNRKRKRFVPASWLEENSDNEWQVSTIPSILERSNTNASSSTNNTATPLPEPTQGSGSTSGESDLSVGEIDGVSDLSVEEEDGLSDMSLENGPIAVMFDLHTGYEAEEDASELSMESETFFEEGQDEVYAGEDIFYDAVEEQQQLDWPEDNDDEEEEYSEDDYESVDEIWEDNCANILPFKEKLKEISRQWVENEIDHRVSKTASNHFWRIANEHFHELYLLKQNQNIKSKVPQICHIRRKMNDEHVPKISMEVAYQNKQTGEITILKNIMNTPVGKYPPRQIHQALRTS